MGKSLFITEKPSVAREFAKALGYNMKNANGYMESEEAIVTWCVGHLVTMSYPDVYDSALKRWSLDTLPFIPETYKYEIIENVKKQFEIVKILFNRPDIDVIYNAGDSGREGEYIQRLVLQMAGYNKNAKLKRIWIDSQTEDEIRRGIREAKDMSAYDNLSNAAYLRAKEDYLMGINFSRVLSLKYSWPVKDYLKLDRAVISVGRVMTCVQGMVVKREREIRGFTKTPFYRVICTAKRDNQSIEGEWKAVEGSNYFESHLLYKENGFKKKEDAQILLEYLQNTSQTENGMEGIIDKIEKKKEVKNPPLLYNLAELQNDCSKLFKISPDETLRIVQELYEKKMTTYPRTDARVLSTAVAKEIHKNINGLKNFQKVSNFANEILSNNSYKNLEKTRYVNDKQITDHYAIIPTGQGLNNLYNTSENATKVYEIICRRFLSIFYPAAVYQKVTLTTVIGCEKIFSNFKALKEEGYLKVIQYSFSKKKNVDKVEKSKVEQQESDKEQNEEDKNCDSSMLEVLNSLKKGQMIQLEDFSIKEGETSPPKRYNSGSIILAMENAGQLIEDEELRSQIKGSGIGTSATRAEILKKLVGNGYLALNKKTQIITPTQLGEMIFEVVDRSIKPLLDPALTASWEKGLTLVSNGEITEDEYMEKLNGFVSRRTLYVKGQYSQNQLIQAFHHIAQFYQKTTKKEKA